MQIRAIEFANDQPSAVTVAMSIDEAALITHWIGHSNRRERDEVKLGFGNAGETIWGCLVGSVFNPYWEAGIEGYVRGDKE